MIKSVKIENFQSHELSTLEFVPGVNVVIGASDAGKSAIFRALTFVINNRPLGDSFRSEWGGDTEVTLTTTDEHVVSRKKTKRDNSYITDGVELKAMGTDVPDAVQKVLTIDAVNVQSQMDAPFLLAASAGEVAKLLNTAADIEGIDLSIAQLNKQHNSARRQAVEVAERIAEQEEELALYEDLPDMQQQADYLDSMYKIFEQSLRKRAALSSIVQRIQRAQKALEQTSDLVAVEKQYKAAEKKHEEHKKRKSDFNNLFRIVTAISNIDEKLKKIGNLDGVEKRYKKLQPIYEQYKEKGVRYRRLQEIVNNVQRIEKQVLSNQQQIDTLQQEYDEIAPDECPLCGANM